MGKIRIIEDENFAGEWGLYLEGAGHLTGRIVEAPMLANAREIAARYNAFEEGGAVERLVGLLNSCGNGTPIIFSPIGEKHFYELVADLEALLAKKEETK